MPLRLVRSASTRMLWDTCAARFLDRAACNPGPANHPAYLWLARRRLLDPLLVAAHDRAISGWLAPPIAFFPELPERFRISGAPIGVLARRELIFRSDLLRHVPDRVVGEEYVRCHNEQVCSGRPNVA
jgi:hypothetical protein